MDFRMSIRHCKSSGPVVIVRGDIDPRLRAGVIRTEEPRIVHAVRMLVDVHPDFSRAWIYQIRGFPDFFVSCVPWAVTIAAVSVPDRNISRHTPKPMGPAQPFLVRVKIFIGWAFKHVPIVC